MADRGQRRRRAGLVGAAVAVAAGVAVGVTAERILLRRTRTGAVDPYADEPFGSQPFDESLTVTTDNGFALYAEVVDPADGVDLELDDLRLDLRQPVRGPNPTLVFIHGFCLDMGTFYFQRLELTRLGEYRMVFYDQPGHGRSGRLAQGEYSLEDLGKALRTVLDQTVPDGPVVLIGHSMGGMTIMAFAEHYPEMFGDRVAAVVLIGTSAGRLEATRVGLPAIVGRVGQPLMPIVNGAARLTSVMVDRARQASSDLAWLLTRKYGFGAARPSGALVSFVERMNSRTSTETVARYLRTLYTHARYPALDALREIPVLVICGERDQITPLALSTEICRRLPDAQLVVVPDSGHVVLLEHSDEVNAALTGFLEKLG
jgi:pimeloyl-ACP methyl ester carboxylesterase